MNLLPGERVLLESDTKNLVLTSHRVRYEMQTTGLTKITSIMLEEVSACEVTTTTKPGLLIAAIVVFLAGLFFNSSISPRDSSAIIGGVVVAVILVLAYFGTRERVISVRSAGGAINASIQGIPPESVRNFIEVLEQAKNERYFAARGAFAASV